MDVSVLGFGGSEIGYERTGARTVVFLDASSHPPTKLRIPANRKVPTAICRRWAMLSW